jgi:hypothetical protein
MSCSRPGINRKRHARTSQRTGPASIVWPNSEDFLAEKWNGRKTDLEPETTIGCRADERQDDWE